ncbi:cyclic peptide export ABC transporter [Candidatus Nitrospira nitrificans]|uniref:Cyclic peptide transporter n=1 Tax=Candidatus Nitrospira nitrificans TaxID=1742973 RepID=A0A0S4LNK0_9BACT|nr:cyclic peptide export ABC transporter [Candidatus Nitrospira nitrificans]CUS39169.1 Cyclic peptide transporter [Candidatus Nitrospira nitrificans]
MSLIRFLYGNSWRLVMLSMVAGLISGLASAGIIAFINSALEESRRTTALGVSFLGGVALVVVTKAFSEVVLTRLGQDIIAQLRVHLSEQILRAPLRHVQELGRHRLLAALNEDTDVIAQAYVQIPLICVNGATVVGCLAYLGWLSWPVLAIVLGFMIFGALSFQAQEKQALHSFKRARETNDTLFRHFQSILEGIKELKLHRERRQAFLATALRPTVTAYKRDFVKGMTVYAIATNWGMFLFYAVIGLALFVLPEWLTLTPQAIAGATLVLLYMMGPFAQIVETLPSVGRADVALEKVETLGLSLEAASAQDQLEKSETVRMKGSGGPVLNIAWKRIELVGVTHRYYREEEEGSFHLGPIELSFTPGELVFLVGGNGSGKTTLALLLLGLYAPESGTIRLDGVPIDEINRENYRQLFSAVFSDYHLFDTLFGLNRTDLDGQAREYVDRLQLQGKVRIRDGEFSTQALSQGQRKRLALLTAYLEDRPFYVFDEWAADQDPVFRRVFYEELLPDLKARGKTALVITHDDQYFSIADRCLRMDLGKIMTVSEGAGAFR